MKVFFNRPHDKWTILRDLLESGTAKRVNGDIVRDLLIERDELYNRLAVQSGWSNGGTYDN